MCCHLPLHSFSLYSCVLLSRSLFPSPLVAPRFIHVYICFPFRPRALFCFPRVCASPYRARTRTPRRAAYSRERRANNRRGRRGRKLRETIEEGTKIERQFVPSGSNGCHASSLRTLSLSVSRLATASTRVHSQLPSSNTHTASFCLLFLSISVLVVVLFTVHCKMDSSPIVTTHTNNKSKSSRKSSLSPS